MKKEKTMKEVTGIGDITIPEPKEVFLVEFHQHEKRVGILKFKGEKLHFKGNATKSAELFFDAVKHIVEQYIQERLLPEPEQQKREAQNEKH